MSVRVPFAAAALRRKPLSELNHAVKKSEGEWRCVLKTHSPLCIRTLFEERRRHGLPPFIPGSSLRGMFRNIVEIIGAGCGQLFTTGTVPENFQRCTAQTGLCLACRLFGTVEERRADPLVWMGKVRVGDSYAPSNWQAGQWKLCDMFGDREMSAPLADNWILFEIGTNTPSPGGGLTCVAKDLEFPFRVWWRDLDPEEGAVLQFAVTLFHREDAFFHKLGFGKAMGLGLVEVRFEEGQAEFDESEMDRYASDHAVWDVLKANRS